MKELYLPTPGCASSAGQLNYAIPSSFLQRVAARRVELIDPSMGRNVARSAADEWRAKVGPAAQRLGRHRRARPAPLPPRQATELQPTIPDAPETGLAVGVLVQHEEYGLGTVTDLSGFGALKP